MRYSFVADQYKLDRTIRPQMNSKKSLTAVRAEYLQAFTTTFLLIEQVTSSSDSLKAHPILIELVQ